MIIQAAIKTSVKIYSLPPPNRHGDICKLIPDEEIRNKDFIMGFLTDKGEFLNRQEAEEYAISHKQVRWRKPKGGLLSENLW